MNWYNRLIRKIAGKDARLFTEAMPRVTNPWTTPDAFQRPQNQKGNIPINDFVKSYVAPMLRDVFPEIPNIDQYTTEIFGNLSRYETGLDKRRNNPEFYEIGAKVKRLTDQAVQLWGGPADSASSKRFQKLLEEIVLQLGYYYQNSAKAGIVKKNPAAPADNNQDIIDIGQDAIKDFPSEEDRRRTASASASRLIKTAMPRRPYKGPPRYFGPMRLISFMGRPAIIGNTMKFDRTVLQQLGFGWQGNTVIDGTQLGDAPDNAINGAMIGSRQLTPEELQMLTDAGVDTSMSATEFQPFNPMAQPEAMPGMEQPVGPDGLIPEQGAQSDAENIEMLMDIRSASGSYQDTKNVVQEQLNKLTEIMSNPNLSEEQAKLKEDFIKFMSGAHKYSFWNSILIFMQNRNAAMVGGAKSLWSNKGRQVKEGQEPLWILAPRITGQRRLSREQYFGMLKQFKDEGMSDEDAKKRIQRYKESTGQLVGFKDVPVYDISQTDPIPGWTDPKTGEGPFDHEGFHNSYLNQMNSPEARADAVWGAATQAMASAGINVGQEDTGSAGGWSSGGEVRIDESSQGERRVATLFHEWAHEVLHTSAEGRAKRTKEQTPKHIIEAEAESTAWLLSQAFGLTGDPEHSARYMLLWKATPKEIMERQENIHKAYSRIYAAVNRQLDQMIGDRPEQQTVASHHMLRYIAARAELRNRIFAGKDDSVCLLRQLAENISDGDGLEVFFMNDDPTSVFLSFGDWADQVEEKVAKFEDEGYSIVEWDYEVGSPGDGWTRVKGTRIKDNL